MNKISLLFIILFTCISISGFSQKERKFIRKGNDQFQENKYQDSEILYRKALEKKANSFAARFNLGDALFKQKKYDEALKQFQSIAATEKDNNNLGKTYHNIGNTLLMQNKIDESINAYKQSLRYHPNSRETKYNLEYARQQKKKQEQQKKKNKENKQNKDDKNKKDQKNKQNKDQQKKDQKNKDQQNKQNQNKDQQKKQDQPKDKQKQGDKQKAQPQQQGKISREDAQRLLEALQNDEKKVQEKVQKARAKKKQDKKAKIKKDW